MFSGFGVRSLVPTLCRLKRCQDVSLVRSLQAALLAGLLHGVDVHGRDVEVHSEVPVDPAGHSAQRDTGSSKLSTMLASATSALFGGRKVSPPDTAATQPLSPRQNTSWYDFDVRCVFEA